MIHFKSYIQSHPRYDGGATRGKDVRYKMSSNENPLGPSPKALYAATKAMLQMNEYGFQDERELEQTLSAHFLHSLTPDQFVIGNGATELIDLICRAFLDIDTSVIICSPTFTAYKHFIELSGADCIDVPLSTPYFLLYVEGILSAIRPDTRLVVLSNPNNPTGTIFTKKKMDILVDHLPADTIVLYDEVYHHYSNSTGYPRAIDYILDGKPVIGLHSFSKAYGLAGCRIGYAFSNPEIARYLRQFHRPFLINRASAEAAIAAISDQAHIERSVSLINTEKEWLYDRLSKLSMRYWPTEANFILTEPPIDAITFTQQMFRRGIMIRETSSFEAPGLVRITIGTRTMNLALVAAMEDVLKNISFIASNEHL